MPPKPRPLKEEIAEALQDPLVAESLAKVLGPFLSLSIDEAVGKRLDQLANTLREVKAENSRISRKLDETAAENDQLKKTLIEQTMRIDDLECYSRSDNIIIRGLPEGSLAERATAATSLDDGISESHESVEKTVIAFVKDSLNVDINSHDISIAHRIKPGPRETVRPIVVRFVSRKMRNLVLRSKKQLRDAGQRVFISEHLTKTASHLFFEARKLVRNKTISSTWTRNGQVMIKPATDSTAKLIRSIADLNGRR
jgi:hypothetical protein